MDLPAEPGPSMVQAGVEEVRARRRQATAAQSKATAHPLRLRILRVCAMEEMTNKQIADRLGQLPGTTLHHVRLLVQAGLLEPGQVRPGRSGALEKPYRTTGLSWWLDGDSPGTSKTSIAEQATAVLQAFAAEVADAGPESVRTFARFVLHLDEDDVRELDAQLLAVIDHYVASDHQRLDKPVTGGLIVLHALDAGDSPERPPEGPPGSTPR